MSYQFDNNLCYVKSNNFAIMIDRGTIIFVAPDRIMYFNGNGEVVGITNDCEKKNLRIGTLARIVCENPFNFTETRLVENIKTIINRLNSAPETVQQTEIEKLRANIELFNIIGDQATEQHTQTTIDTIIFDIGGVFSFPDPNLLYKIAHWAVNSEIAFGDLRCFEHKTEGSYPLIANVINLFENAWNKLRAEGEHYNSTKAYEEFISLLTTNIDSISSPYLRPVCSRYFDLMNMRVIATYTDDLLNDLRKKGYKLYYLSNLCQFQLDRQKKLHRLDFLEEFDGGVFSCETLWRKPNEKLYWFLIEKYKINPKSSLFLDDVQENVDTAKKIGFDSMLFDAVYDSPYQQLNSSPILQTLYELPSIV